MSLSSLLASKIAFLYDSLQLFRTFQSSQKELISAEPFCLVRDVIEARGCIRPWRTKKFSCRRTSFFVGSWTCARGLGSLDLQISSMILSFSLVGGPSESLANSLFNLSFFLFAASCHLEMMTLTQPLAPRARSLSAKRPRVTGLGGQVWKSENFWKLS